jgi:hypothetical protein
MKHEHYVNGRCISAGRNVMKKYAEKTLKSKDLTTETQRMSNVKTKVIPQTMTTGTNITHKIPQQHTGKARHDGTTDNSHTGTAHVLREVLV